MVDFLSGDELTVVETQTIVEQEFDIGNDQFTTMLVDSVLQFLLNHRQDATENLHFARGKMQRLIA